MHQRTATHRHHNDDDNQHVIPTFVVDNTTDSSSKKRRHKKCNLLPNERDLPLLLLIFVMVASLSSICYLILLPNSSSSSSSHELQIENESLRKKLEAYKERIYGYESEKTNIAAEVKTLQFQNAQLIKESAESQRNDRLDQRQFNALLERDEFLLNYASRLRQGIQSLSRRELKKKFGEGPYRVRIDLEFPPNSTTGDNAEHKSSSTASFVIEMAPISLMPHSVYTFLNWVEYDLLSGTHFYLNPGHIIQAGPLAQDIRQKFRNVGLSNVLFQEYHPDVPHEQYTVGFAGRPGGPSWYVSLRNNTVIHGPGGQPAGGNLIEADPCFGKVVEGFDTVRRISFMFVQDEENPKFLKDNVKITSVTLLKN